MTTVKANRTTSAIDNDVTVEQYLTAQCDTLINDVRQHGDNLIAKFRSEYKEQYDLIMQKLQQNEDRGTTSRICILLKCIAGPHSGQKFRLEPTNANGTDSFKVGRGTSKLLKEKGVSLYKDKEISSSHALFEIKNGEILLIDTGSTNGTQINNGPELDKHVPYRLNEGDVVCVGSTELVVSICPIEEDEAIL